MWVLGMIDRPLFVFFLSVLGLRKSVANPDPPARKHQQNPDPPGGRGGRNRQKKGDRPRGSKKVYLEHLYATAEGQRNRWTDKRTHTETDVQTEIEIQLDRQRGKDLTAATEDGGGQSTMMRLIT